MLPQLARYALPIVMLVSANVFMTFAWYGHLKYKEAALITVILASWGIAFFEYCLQVPANRLGHEVFSVTQLKTLQEVITLAVFAIFAVVWLGESLRWNHAVAFGLLVAASFFVFLPDRTRHDDEKSAGPGESAGLRSRTHGAPADPPTPGAGTQHLPGRSTPGP